MNRPTIYDSGEEFSTIRRRLVSLDTYAQQTGIRKAQLLYYVRKGRIEGACFDRTIWQWRIPSTAKLLIGRQS
jgi:hypothetical protein